MGVGGNGFFGGAALQGIIWATTNGGQLWGYQLPDTSIHVFKYGVLDFINGLTGWAYNAGGNNGVYTNVGGGPIVSIKKEYIVLNVSDYELKQNYPNPFNPETVIEFSIKQNSTVNLIIYDVLGKEVLSIYRNERLNSGNYKVSFNANNFSGGVYFYTLSTENFKLTKKMILLK